MSEQYPAANRPESTSVEDLVDAGTAQSDGFRNRADRCTVSVGLTDRVVSFLGRLSRLVGGSSGGGEGLHLELLCLLAKGLGVFEHRALCHRVSQERGVEVGGTVFELLGLCDERGLRGGAGHGVLPVCGVLHV